MGDEQNHTASDESFSQEVNGKHRTQSKCGSMVKTHKNKLNKQINEI